MLWRLENSTSRLGGAGASYWILFSFTWLSFSAIPLHLSVVLWDQGQIVDRILQIWDHRDIYHKCFLVKFIDYEIKNIRTGRQRLRQSRFLLSSWMDHMVTKYIVRTRWCDDKGDLKDVILNGCCTYFDDDKIDFASLKWVATIWALSQLLLFTYFVMFALLEYCLSYYTWYSWQIFRRNCFQPLIKYVLTFTWLGTFRLCTAKNIHLVKIFPHLFPSF